MTWHGYDVEGTKVLVDQAPVGLWRFVCDVTRQSWLHLAMEGYRIWL
jgi:hypothetical protein